MAILVAGLYKVELFQTYFSQQMINTFWYRHESDDNTKALDLSADFNASIMSFIANAQNTGVTYENLKVTPIFGTGVEVDVTPGDPAGLVVGTEMPTFVAASIKLTRSTSELRSGWKRFSGLIEENVGATSFGGAFVTLLDSLAGVLNNQIGASPDSFTPYIVRKPFSTIAQNDFWEGIPVGTTVTLNRPTTQNSRKAF